MTSPAPTVRDRLHEPFWSFRALPRSLRVLLVVVVGLLIVGDSLLRMTSGATIGLWDAAVGVAITLAFGVFAWRPPVGATALIVAAVAAAATGTAGDYLIGLVLALGLVSYTCSGLLTLVYLATVIGWAIIEIVGPSSLMEPVGLVIMASLGAISAVLGITLRRQLDRWTALSAQVERTEREMAAQLTHERDLIADELHDIVAHEITLVALHASVLERTDDPQTRHQSQTAIRNASVQALTDIRRVLGMVRGEENLAPERAPTPETFAEALDDVRAELDSAGIAVAAEIPDDIELPNASLLVLVRVLRESTTNVLKHATGARTVRIVLAVERGWARLTIADDSPARQSAGLPTSGYGLVRLRERLRLFGGTFDADRLDGRWTVTASLPLNG